MRYKSKEDLLSQVIDEREQLLALIESIPLDRRDEAGVWGDGWTACDLLAHLAEWHWLFLGWLRTGKDGSTPDLPATGYKWNETPRLNRHFAEKNHGRGFEAVRADFDASFEEVRDVLEALSESELFDSGHFSWTRKNGLVTYAGANTASHYRFAQKVLKRWIRGVGL